MAAPSSTGAGQQPMEADSFSSPEQDSGYDEDSIRGLLTSSLTSSIYDYREIHGRTYHAYKDTQYEFPNDKLELDRLDLQHHLYYKRLDGKLFLAPISDTPQNVLDVGTGTGIWAIEFAERYPSASVIGTDLSPVQAKWLPSNAQVSLLNSPQSVCSEILSRLN